MQVQPSAPRHRLSPGLVLPGVSHGQGSLCYQCTRCLSSFAWPSGLLANIFDAEQPLCWHRAGRCCCDARLCMCPSSRVWLWLQPVLLQLLARRPAIGGCEVGQSTCSTVGLGRAYPSGDQLQGRHWRATPACVCRAVCAGWPNKQHGFGGWSFTVCHQGRPEGRLGQRMNRPAVVCVPPRMLGIPQHVVVAAGSVLEMAGWFCAAGAFRMMLAAPRCLMTGLQQVISSCPTRYRPWQTMELANRWMHGGACYGRGGAVDSKLVQGASSEVRSQAMICRQPLQEPLHFCCWLGVQLAWLNSIHQQQVALRPCRGYRCP